MAGFGLKLRGAADKLGHWLFIGFLGATALIFAVLLFVGVISPVAQSAFEDVFQPHYSVPEPVADAPIASDSEVVLPVPERWVCNWAPTMNDDWHDDVLCTRGADSDRPILLVDQAYVTQAEMMAAAAVYEAQLMGASP